MESALPAWRTFSIFISSTFADMQSERDYLKHHVFPRVEEALEPRRIKLEVVDLRWGVDTTSIAQEDERETSVLKVCLDEIRRCRPFFIGLLGDRYGWVPPEERMKAALAGEEHIILEKGKSVTDLEIEFGVLASKEQLVRSVFYFREPLPYAMFTEKWAGMFSDEHNPELSVVERSERKVSLENLKVKIRNHFGINEQKEKVKTYFCSWDEEAEKVTGLEPWGELVYKDILAECESHAKDTWDKVPKNWQEQELALLDAFIERNTVTFCGRKPLLMEIKEHLLSAGTDPWGLVLTGESGSGKSAVFSMVCKEMRNEDCFILAHSAGLSPRAKSVADLLQVWNKQLSEYLGIAEARVAETERSDDISARLSGEPGKKPASPIEKLQEKFLELLQVAAPKKRVLLLIDALDRFEPTARAQHLSWLPPAMPSNIRMLITAITGTGQKALNYHKGLREKSIDIFSPEEAKEMLLALCKRQHKALPEKVRDVLLDKQRNDGQPATASPLWLSLAVNMMMALDRDDFEKISRLEGRGGEQIETYMAGMAQGFDPEPGLLFLSLVEKAGLLFGDKFTPAVFNFLACSRNGLREKDLEKLLPSENIDWDPLIFAGLRRWFKVHLILQGEDLQWNLAHTILRNTLAEKLPPADLKQLHKEIGLHLMNLPDLDTLQISESMYHLMQNGNKEVAANWYGSFKSGDPRTEGSSKAMAEAVIFDETAGKNEWLEWMSSFPVYVDNEKLISRTISKNFLYSLFDRHFQSDIDIQNRISLVQTSEANLEVLHHRDPDSVGCARDLSVSNSKLGDLYLLLGDLPKALDKYKACLTIVEELRNQDPDSTLYARDLSVSCERLGDLYLKLGDLPKALDKYQVSLTLSEELCHRAPDSADYAHDLAVSCDSLGELYLKLGDPLKALDKYEASLTIRKEICLRAPNSADYAYDQAISHDKLGDLYLTLAEPLKAFDKYQESMKIREVLRSRAPDSAVYAGGLARSYIRLGDHYLDSGLLPKALEKYQAYETIVMELCRQTPDSTDCLEHLAFLDERFGRLYLILGEPLKALDKYQSSHLGWEVLCRQAPDSSDYKHFLSMSFIRLGDLYLKLGDNPKAHDKYQASLTIQEELHRLAPDSREYAQRLVVCFYKLMSFLDGQKDQKSQSKYAGRCLQTLLYMKEHGMFITPFYQQLMKSLSDERVALEQSDRKETVPTLLSNDESDEDAVSGLIEMCLYDEAISLLKSREEEIRNLVNPEGKNIQNQSAQAYVYAKMGKFEQAFRKYELVSELCARNKIFDTYADSLLSQAELLIEHLGNQKWAKSLLEEAILVAQENGFSQLEKEARNMLKDIS